MTMTRQHFQMIADVIAETVTDRDIDDCVRAPLMYHLSRKFAARLAQSNPRFDRERFLRACGVE